jgi:hypothetical protein
MALLSRTLIDEVDELVLTSVPKTNHATDRDSRLVRQKRCVTFAAEEEIHEIPHVEELSVDECRALYYAKKKNSRRIAKENIETLRLMKKGHFPGTEKLYFRGLEGQLPQAKHRSHQRIRFAVEAVLQEQQFGIIHPYWVNNFYCAYTVDATHVAHIMGVWDAEAVQAEEAAVLQDKSQADHR